jgi:hypothetical protein
LSKIARSLYTPLSVATGVGGGLLAGAIFGRVWQRVGENDAEPPDPNDLSQSIKTVIAAAAVQGLIVGVVRALVQRANAHGYQAVAHERPPS